MFELQFIQYGSFGLVSLVMIYFLRSLPSIKDTVADLEEKVDKLLELVRKEHNCEEHENGNTQK